MASPTEIRKGKVIKHQGAPHIVLDMQHRTQGRQAGFVQVSLRNLQSGSSTTHKFRSTDTVDIMHTDTHKLEFSYIDGSHYHFMDPETFEDLVLEESMVENVKDFLVENQLYDVLMVEGEPFQIELPSSLEMKVVSSPEGVKGDTASNVQKPATLETGLTVQVPLFIKEGDTIKVNTSDKSYVSRA